MAESGINDSSAPSRSRRERKKERTRVEIYTAAMTLFLKRGFDAVTIDEICRAADVARATFFLHFPAKEALLAEYGQRANQELAAALRATRGSATATIRMTFTMLAERAERHPELVRMLVREIVTRPPALSQQDEQARDLVELLAAVIRRGQASGEFRKRLEPRVAALAAAASFFAVIYAWARSDREIALNPVLNETLDVILHGLSERKARHG